MIERLIQGMKDNVVALAAHGKVSHKDYELVVIPTVEEKIRMHAKVRLSSTWGRILLGTPQKRSGTTPRSAWHISTHLKKSWW